MSFVSGFQLSLELTNTLNAARQAVSATKDLINFSRLLRNSGSDILVEEDLKDVFGRMRIEHTLESDFKQKLTTGTSIKSLYNESVIDLRAGPGPTVERALRDKDRRYMSTVIQLSLLAWAHDRTSLTEAISECLNKRMELNLPGAQPSPGFEGIYKTLEACSSQTSAFAWSRYTSEVRHHLFRLCPPRPDDNHASIAVVEALSLDILLAAMDCLCLVQSLPEDRQMLVRSSTGAVPLIVWAHHILGLTVQVLSGGEAIYFGNGTPQVTLRLDSKRFLNEGLQRTSPVVLLLDKKLEVILKYVSTDALGVRLQGGHRHPLQGYATEWLRNYFNKITLMENDNPVFTETAQLVVALAIVKSAVLYRVNSESEIAQDSRSFVSRHITLERWRVFNMAEVIFAGIPLDKGEIETYVSVVLSSWTAEKVLADDITLPNAMSAFIGSIEPPECAKHSNSRLKKDKDSGRNSLNDMVTSLVGFLLVFAHVLNPRDCTALPITFTSFQSTNSIYEDLDEGRWIALEEHTIFYGILSLLIGNTFDFDSHRHCFLASDFGWSVYLSNCEDGDPGSVRPELVSVTQGVPTNAKTQERKTRMVDTEPSRIGTNLRVHDKGADYIPRCEMSVLARTEYFSTRANEFISDIHFEVNPSSGGSSHKPVITCSYRHLHRSLWMAQLTNSTTQCPHSVRKTAKAQLGLGAATVEGYDWESQNVESGSSIISERVCISLVLNDRRARWLAIEGAARCKVRKAMLRSDDCCVNCALEATAKSQGKWILIL